MSLIFNKQNDLQMDFVKVLGYNIRIIRINRTKSSKTLVLLHGLGASAERWSELWSYLTEYDVVIPDIIGFGYSEKPLIEYKIDFFMSFLKEFFAELNIIKPIILGTSFGGQLVLEYYIKNRNFFNKMILVSPSGILERPTFVLSQYVFSALYPTIENVTVAFQMMATEDFHVNPFAIKDFINRMRLPNAKYALISTLLALRKNTVLERELNRIDIPTLVIWGRKDKTIPVENIKYFENNSYVKTVIMEDCGHAPYVENPLEFYKIMRKFIG